MDMSNKPERLIRIIVSESSDGTIFWVNSGKLSIHAFRSKQEAMDYAFRLFEEAGGDGKAVIIDVTERPYDQDE